METPDFRQEAAQEIVDYLKSGQLFHSFPHQYAIERIPALVIKSLKGIDKYRDPDAPGARIKFPMHWNDIIGDTIIEHLRVTKSWTREQTSEHSNLARSIFEFCWISNPDGEARALAIMPEGLEASDLGCLIDGIIRHRMVCGILPGHMNETFWQIIQWGGFPCGWCGGRDGMLVVYIPPSVDRIK